MNGTLSAYNRTAPKCKMQNVVSCLRVVLSRGKPARAEHGTTALNKFAHCLCLVPKRKSSPIFILTSCVALISILNALQPSTKVILISGRKRRHIFEKVADTTTKQRLWHCLCLVQQQQKKALPFSY